MRRAVRASIALIASALLSPSARADERKEAAPFKLGTFEFRGRTFVGLVRTDGTVIDVGGGLAALEKSHPSRAKLEPPSGMRDLITRYDALKERLAALAMSSGAGAPYVHSLSTVKVRTPVPDPETMLNAAVNYTEHESEMAGRPAAPPSPTANPPRSAPGLWER